MRIGAVATAVTLYSLSCPAQAEELPSFATDGQLTACTNPTLPPMTFVNGADTSAVAGFDIDVTRELARMWHLKPVITTMDFEGMFPSLASERCGIVISGVLRQTGREKNYDAVPYLDSSIVVIAKSGTPKIASLSDLAGQSVAVETGTSYEALIEKENKVLASQGRPAIQLQMYPSEDQVIQQVLIGRVHALISQDVEVFFRQKQLGGKVSIILTPDNPDFREFAIYLRKNAHDKALLQAAISDMKQRGLLEQLSHKWGISDQEAQVFSEQNAPSAFSVPVFVSALTSAAFLKGAALTLIVAVLSHLTAILISIPVALKLNGPRSPLQMFLTAYVGVFRGAPTLLQLLFIWNALPQFFPIFRESWFTPFLATWISLSINESAYQVEINRAALRAVDSGQLLAAEALGMKKSVIYRHVIFPQALRIALPPTINDFISLLKTTSLASVISLQELLAVTQIQVARTFQFTEYYSAALVWYLAMVFFFLYLQKRIERRFSWADRNEATANG
ncbi:ABC transporter substrate-binding protein/permease [Acetobacter conturbans]|uniref:ABC transporter permease subunit n=1 Tax=Acetobacter conturbans TaxID=1737472 RepID=A0ABX0K470_9PROT|nr:ABC transporter substrate-binding protein/permease [Acetobacter conturbans]NHN88239.1 ABC transporter permease subunit [Acetobacter conturbans]